MITMTDNFYSHYNNEQMGSMKSNHIKQLITLTMITLSSFHCTKYCCCLKTLSIDLCCSWCSREPPSWLASIETKVENLSSRRRSVRSADGCSTRSSCSEACDGNWRDPRDWSCQPEIKTFCCTDFRIPSFDTWNQNIKTRFLNIKNQIAF